MFCKSFGGLNKIIDSKSIKMKKLLLALMIALGISSLNAQYSVTLKVIDNQDGALTNNVNDNNETNVFCWAGNDAGALYDGDWWYPMYQGESGRTGGALIKDSDVWTWQCTFYNVAPGDYRWNPHMKTLGWAPINNLYNYNESADLHFAVGTDGTVTGQTILELPLNATGEQDILEGDLVVYSKEKTIVIMNAQEGERLSVFNMSGTLIKQIQSASTRDEINVDTSGIYLVKTKDASVKVLVK